MTKPVSCVTPTGRTFDTEMKATVTHYENTRVRKAISDCHWQQFSICGLQPLYYYCSGNLTTKSATHIPMCKLHFQKTFQTPTKASCNKDFKTSLHKWTNTMTHTETRLKNCVTSCVSHFLTLISRLPNMACMRICSTHPHSCADNL